MRWIALALLLLVFGLHAPILADGMLLGAPKTDALRAVWGFDHQARGWPLPFWTDRIGFPVGVKVLILPFASSMLGAPLALLGAVRGYSLWALGLCAMTGIATAWWLRTLTGSHAAAAMAGAAMVLQPSMLLALTDGTPEHVAFWGVPALLGALWMARGPAPAPWGLVAGAAATLVAMDSPYHAIFAVPMVLALLPGTPRPALLRFFAASALGGLVLVGLYWGLPLAGPLDNRSQNAVKLPVWWEWESGRRPSPWDHTYTPAFVPAASLLAAAVLALLRPRRGGAWIAIALLAFAFALSTATENVVAFRRWGGAAGEAFGNGIVWVNETLSPDMIRFPRRWLTPATFALWTAAGIGLTRLPREWMRWLLAAPVAAGTLALTLKETRYAEALPGFHPPDPAFAAFIRESELDGEVLIAPQIRGALRKHERFELPVYADLGPTLTSADMYWLQVAVGRGVVNSPQGLFTLVARAAPPEELGKFMRDLDDLCKPQTTGDPIPPSATQEPERRAAQGARLVEAGLRFVVLDEAAFGAEGLELARLAFAGHVTEARHFDDGTGVTVFVLE